MRTPTISTVVVNLNRVELLKQCLRSVVGAARSAEVDCEIIVVDNGSTDGSVAFVRREHPHAVLIEFTANEGFAGGMRSGLERAHAEWVLAINNDATLDSAAMRRLLETARAADARVGAVAAQMRFAACPQLINSAGIEVDRLGVAFDRCLGEPIEFGGEVEEVFGACGGAALYRRAMLDDIGGFDADYFAYLEDVDVAWRARMRGWRTLYDPSAIVIHHHSGTSGHGSAFKDRLVGRNRIRLLARNATSRQLVRYGPHILFYELAYVMYATLTRRSFASVAGRLDGVRNWRRDRRDAAPRTEVPLAPVAGLRAAFRRNAAWPG